jgi:hypothetical protein
LTDAKRRSRVRPAPPRKRERTREDESTPKWYAHPRNAILSAGAVAGAVASILALTGSVRAMFAGGPEGKVKVLEIQDVTPLTYGGWVVHERGNRKDVPPEQVSLPGQLIAYRVVTEGFEKNSELPVRLILHNLSSGAFTAKDGDPIKVHEGTDCGCSDWLLIPRRGHRYKVEIQIYRPGGMDGSPEQVAFREFVAA